MIVRSWPQLGAGWAVRAFAIVGLAICLSFVAGFGYWLSVPGPKNPAPKLATWLEAHHLRNGIGDYWAASITTVESRGVVTVRPVSARPGGTIQRMNLSAASWYADHRFQFLVYEMPDVNNVGVNLKSAIRTYGTPARIFAVGPYRILVWNHALSVSPRLSS